MEVVPFTRKAAIALAAKHQGLVGKKYTDENGIEHTGMLCTSRARRSRYEDVFSLDLLQRD